MECSTIVLPQRGMWRIVLKATVANHFYAVKYLCLFWSVVEFPNNKTV